MAVEAAGDPLHGGLAVDEHGQCVVDDEFVEEGRFFVGVEFDVGA